MTGNVLNFSSAAIRNEVGERLTEIEAGMDGLILSMQGMLSEIEKSAPFSQKELDQARYSYVRTVLLRASLARDFKKRISFAREANDVTATIEDDDIRLKAEEDIFKTIPEEVLGFGLSTQAAPEQDEPV